MKRSTLFNFLFVFLVTAFMAILAVSAKAQSSGPLTLLPGGTNNVAVAATNTLTTFACSEYDNFGLQVSFKAPGAATSTLQIFGFQSFDGSNYETTPSFSQLVTFNGTTLVQTNINIAVPNGWTYKIQIGNTNETVAATNVTAKVVFKSPKRFPKQ